LDIHNVDALRMDDCPRNMALYADDEENCSNALHF
jgi:hypothetical protein